MQKNPKQLHRNTSFYKMIKYRADLLNYDIGGEKMNRDELLVVTDTLMREPPRSGLVQ
jgi:hypothetical protein